VSASFKPYCTLSKNIGALNKVPVLSGVTQKPPECDEGGETGEVDEDHGSHALETKIS
jgi:hypothetical protein